MSKGNLIVIEGACDGIGKSTQYNLLKERLKKEGSKVICHHFPSYDIRFILNGILNCSFISAPTSAAFFAFSGLFKGE